MVGWWGGPPGECAGGQARSWEDKTILMDNKRVVLEEGMATHSSILAWRTLWIEEPGGLQSIGSQRVRHD